MNSLNSKKNKKIKKYEHTRETSWINSWNKKV